MGAFGPITATAFIYYCTISLAFQDAIIKQFTIQKQVASADLAIEDLFSNRR